MNFIRTGLLLPLLLCLGCRPALSPGPSSTTGPDGMRVYLTLADSSMLLQESESKGSLQNRENTPDININAELRYQSMQGFGYTLTGGSAQLIHQLPESERAALLTELFGRGEGSIGVSYLRLSLGASDLDAEVFSYAELPDGQSDPELESFSLDPDRRHLIPVLKEIISINPDIGLMASPWSPPVWMKDNGASKGGSLLPAFYPVYADYFVRYVRGMAEEGITIDAVTVQNEPLHPGNNPSLLMPAEEQAEFVGQHLGPAFAKAGLETRIVIYDHNADRPDYPLTILQNAEARQYVDGTAFHLYGGEIEALTAVHEAYRDKHLYFTEQWIGAPGNFAEDLQWHVRELFIGAPGNWAETVLEWNLAADPQQDPHTEGGCTRCLGALTIDGSRISRNTAYYTVAHSSRFVPAGSERVGSDGPDELPNVAYRTPQGEVVLLVLNDSSQEQDFEVSLGGRVFPLSLPGGAVATCVLAY